MRWGLTYRNVADAVDPSRTQQREVSPPDTSQVHEILDLAESTPYGPPLTFLARTGCRRGECLGLRRTDVDLDNRTASIAQTLQRVCRQGLVFQPPKSAKSRRAIALDDETVTTLRDHQGTQVLTKMELGATFEDHGLAFPGPFGRWTLRL